MRRIALVLPLLALSLAAEGKAGERWFSFAAYPGARPLCNEHIVGNTMHISWMSFATKDELKKVVAFYEKDQGAKAEPSENGEQEIHAPARNDDIVAMFPADQADHFPSCSEKPARGEKTVILVSSAAR